MANLSERGILNNLIATCTDAERGFRTAATLVEDDQLKTLFLGMASERARFASELLPHAQRLGGPAASDGTTAGTWHRHWMDLKNRVTPHNDRAIVVEAERGDAVSIRGYTDAVNGALPPTMRDLIEQQLAAILSSYQRFEALRDGQAA
jgi:uncharacterized protein (TIGR02284 family)